MRRNEIIDNLFKSILNPRIESLERDGVSHCSDLKICNDFVNELEILYNELKILCPPEIAPEPHSEISTYRRKESASSHNLLNHVPKPREKTPTLKSSKTTSKLTQINQLSQTKNIESSPTSKKSEKMDRKPSLSSLHKQQPVLSKTKTTSALKIVGSNNTKVSKEDKPKISIKIDIPKDESTVIVGSKTSRLTTNGGLNLKDTPKLERNATSKSSLLPTNKIDNLKSTSVSGTKTIVKPQTQKEKIVKPSDDKSNIEEMKIDKKQSISFINKESIKALTPLPNNPQRQINNLAIACEIQVPDKLITPKKEIINTIDILKWTISGKFLTKNDILKLKVNKSVTMHISTIYIKWLESDVKIYEQKLSSIKEKNKEEELLKQVSEFTTGRSAIKALELLNHDKYRELFKNEKVPQEDILLPFRIYFTLINRKDIYLQEDYDFWKECCMYFLSEVKTGDLIANSVKSFDFSNDCLFKVLRLSINKEKKLMPSYYSKICSTTGIIIFLIKDTLEYIGLISTDKKTLPGANKLFKLYSAVIEQTYIRIKHLKEFVK